MLLSCMLLLSETDLAPFGRNLSGNVSKLKTPESIKTADICN